LGSLIESSIFFVRIWIKRDKRKMDRLFVVNKPPFTSSNRYINRVKREHKLKKLGYSGTLDPFATGSLIVATGKYTKLFQYLDKSPKTYIATLWLGAESESLDIENIIKVKTTPKIDLKDVENALFSLKGDIKYRPPKYSAKNIQGERAYKLAREGKSVNLKEIKSTVYNVELLHYTHPFINFKITVSTGSYIRSFGNIICSKLGVVGTLSSLRRVREGKFRYENMKDLNPLDFLKIPRNIYLGDEVDLKLGKKISVNNFKNREENIYFIESSNFFSIIEIRNSEVKYRLNLLPKFKQKIGG